MDKRIDLTLNATLAKHRYGAEYASYEDGARDFLRLLRSVDSLPIFDLGWSMADTRLWEQEAEYLDQARKDAEASEYADEEGFIDINDDAVRLIGVDKVFYILSYGWGSYDTRLIAEFLRFHPEYDLHADQMIAFIDAITRWKHPQHLRCGPMSYMRDHHPLDRAREGIGWMGWTPFALTLSDVPEAALVREMNGGSLIVTQLDFWQSFPRHPLYSKGAIERAQEVETRLNILGVLPTHIELARGDWGR